jgi:pyruvate/2-oxoglutarate dehydrogenase complex dihydrolipoamide acyltransferase (E2) component
MNFELKMPDLSTTGSPIKVIRWLVAVSESFERGQALLDVETDKATMEVEALNPGILLKQIVHAGQEANAGDFLFLASDQIINNAAKMRYMSGGRCQVPLVMRAPMDATAADRCARSSGSTTLGF